MNPDQTIMSAVESAYNTSPFDPVDIIARVGALTALHGEGPVLAALAHLHLSAAARLRFRSTPAD